MKLTLVQIETVAAVAGIFGALLLALSAHHQAAGFALFLISNVGWIIFSAAQKHWRFLVQQVCFFGTSLLGLWNWWFMPLLAGGLKP